MKKITDFIQMYGTRWINVFLLKGKTSDNKDINWVIASRAHKPKIFTDTINKPDAVLIEAYLIDDETNEQRLVVTKEYRYPLNGYEVGLPAGLIDSKESVEEAAIRELKEETGYNTFKIISVSPVLFSSSGLTDESVQVVKLICKDVGDKQNLDELEDISTYTLNQHEVHEMIRTCKLDGDNVYFGAKGYFILEKFCNK